MAIADKSLVCKDCGNEFLFSAREQEFYAEKGFENEPSRCPDCRKARKQRNNGGFQRGSRNGSFGRSERQMFSVTCSECGTPTEVPFKPNGFKPVYCSSCYQKKVVR